MKNVLDKMTSGNTKVLVSDTAAMNTAIAVKEFDLDPKVEYVLFIKIYQAPTIDGKSIMTRDRVQKVEKPEPLLDSWLTGFYRKALKSAGLTLDGSYSENIGDIELIYSISDGANMTEVQHRMLKAKETLVTTTRDIMDSNARIRRLLDKGFQDRVEYEINTVDGAYMKSAFIYSRGTTDTVVIH